MTERIVTTLRLPPDVKAFHEEEARHNMSSQNSEIVRALRAHMRTRAARSRRSTGEAHLYQSAQNA